MSATKLVVQGAAGVAGGGGVSEPTFVSFGDEGTDVDIGLTVRSLKLDSSDNIYFVGSGGYVVKYDKDLALQWSKVLSDGATIAFYDVEAGDDGRIYAVGQTSQNSLGSTDSLCLQLSSSGTVEHHCQFGGTSTDNAWGCALDSSGILYSVGERNNDFLYVKHKNEEATPSVDVLSSAVLDGVSTTEAKDIIIDSNDNVYISGRTLNLTQGVGGWDVLIAKMTTDPTASSVWVKAVGTTSTESISQTQLTAVDSSGNVFINQQTNDCFFIVKLNSSGSKQWSKTFEVTSSVSTADDLITTGCEVDSEGNVYASYVTTQAYRPRAWGLLKLDTDGNVIWGRRIAMLWDSDMYGRFKIDSNDDIVVLARTGASKVTLGKLPKDGSGQGIYEHFTYYDYTPTLITKTISVNNVTSHDFASQTISQKNNTNTLGSYPQTRTHATSTDTKLDLSYSGISLVSSATQRWSGTSNNRVLDIKSLGAIQDDLVIGFYAIGQVTTNGSVSGSWTQDFVQANSSTGDVTLRYFYKKMTSAPDGTITFNSGTGSTAAGGAVQVYVLRGVDTTTPFDVSAVSATKTNGHTIQPASITPTTSGSLILVGAGFGHNDGLAVSFDCDNLDSFTCDTTGLDTYEASLCTGFKAWSSGAFQPSTIDVRHTSSTTDASATWTLALRPAS